jgi:hypothetical protein
MELIQALTSKGCNENTNIYKYHTYILTPTQVLDSEEQREGEMTLKEGLLSHSHAPLHRPGRSLIVSRHVSDPLKFLT